MRTGWKRKAAAHNSFSYFTLQNQWQNSTSMLPHAGTHSARLDLWARTQVQYGRLKSAAGVHHRHQVDRIFFPPAIPERRKMLLPTPSFCRPPSPPSSSSTSVLRVSLCGGGGGGGRRYVLPSRTLSITCMANQRRVKMVAKQIRREISDMLLTDKVLKYAILPEASLGADRYLSSLTTISDVEVSGDLQVVKVYISVFGDERGKEVAIAGLKSKAKYVRSELGKRMKLRLTPEIRFIEDDSLERGSRVIAILDRLKDERENSGRQEAEKSKASELSEVDHDWGKDDPDEGIIYVK